MSPDITDERLIARRVQAALRRIAEVQERIDEAIAAARQRESGQAGGAREETQRTAGETGDAA